MWLLLSGCLHPSMDAPAASCESCHSVTVPAWRGSRHAVAHDNPIFAESFRRAEDPWCLSCHGEEQVNCASCHGSSARSCEDCHQFDLPGTALASQDTAREHRASAFAQERCIDCHDPHRPSGAHDHQAVRRALEVEVEPGRLRIGTVDVGHAFPTGDPHRRLEFAVCADLLCKDVVQRHVFERRLENIDGHWRVASDTRIPPPVDGRRSGVERSLVPGRSWRLIYHLADPRHPALPSSRWVVDEGWLP